MIFKLKYNQPVLKLLTYRSQGNKCEDHCRGIMTVTEAAYSTETSLNIRQTIWPYNSDDSQLSFCTEFAFLVNLLWSKFS